MQRQKETNGKHSTMMSAIGEIIIGFGNGAVQKSYWLGMYESKIPEILKAVKTSEK